MVVSMRKFRLLQLSVTALVMIVCIGIVALSIFAVRRPVVVVTDAAFDELYGRRRIALQKNAASLRLFRRILVATVADSAAPTAAAEAAAAASPSPFCVVFSSWYEAGAALYASRFADVPAVVVGLSDDSHGSLPMGYSADKLTDMYRAGLIAGLLCAEGGRPLLLTDSALDSLAAFNAGLSDSMFSGEPVVLLPGDPVPSTDRYACLVAEAPLRDSPALELPDMPLVLFSWIDPTLAPPKTVAIFDDSIWATLESAVRSVRGGNKGASPSRIWLLIDSKLKDSRRIRSVIAESYAVHNSL